MAPIQRREMLVQDSDSDREGLLVFRAFERSTCGFDLALGAVEAFRKWPVGRVDGRNLEVVLVVEKGRIIRSSAGPGTPGFRFKVRKS